MQKSLSAAKIVGFFSIPHPSLCEHNPAAYSAAMAEAPKGAGSCSHCGTGILHHVIITDGSGVTRFIGTDCAKKIGLDKEQIRRKVTDEEKAARDARRASMREEWEKNEEQRKQAEQDRLAERMEMVGDLVSMLRRAAGYSNDFYRSLANQLEQGPLSPRQAYYVAKLTSSTGRRNKQNANAWDAVIDRCVCMTETEKSEQS